MSTSIPILLVHRNELERSALKAAFETLPNVQIAGERSDLRAGIALAHQTRPAILVLELSAPVDDTLAAAGQYKLNHPDVAIFFATDLMDPDTLLRAMRAGASEVLRRPLDRSAVVQAVERVAALSARAKGGGRRGTSSPCSPARAGRG